MDKKVIYIGLGAVVAYLLYKKFVSKPTEVKSAEAEVEEEPAAEETPAGGGGGGGGAASAPSASSEAEATPMTKSAAIKPTSVSGLAVAKPRNIGTAQRPTKPLTSSKPVTMGKPPIPAQIRINPKLTGKLAAPRATAVAARFDAYSDFDSLLTEERQSSGGSSRIKPTSVSGISIAQRPRNYGTAQRPTRPLGSKKVNPIATSTRMMDTMDFDGDNDTLAAIM